MNNKLNQKGITLVAMIITVILMLILATLAFRYSKFAIHKSDLENLKTNMLLIQGKARTIYEKYSFKDIDTLVGTEVGEGNITLTPGVSNKLNSQEGTYYILEQSDLNSMGLGSIEVDTESFYIVDYSSFEVYYSIGYTEGNTTYYSLTELQALD